MDGYPKEIREKIATISGCGESEFPHFLTFAATNNNLSPLLEYINQQGSAPIIILRTLRIMVI
jgi:hypothetical protein